MRIPFYPIAAICVIFFLASCSSTNPRYIHNPAVYNASFFRQQGDLKLSGAFAANPNNLFSDMDPDSSSKDKMDKNLGFDVQAAVAVTDHFMIQVAGMRRFEKDRFNDDDLLDANGSSKINYTRSMIDVGAGFYTAMGASQKVYFNGIFGAGFGSSKSTDKGSPTERNRYYDYNFVKYHITPSFNFFFSDNARLSVAPQFSLMTNSNIKTNYTEDEQARVGYNTLPNKSKVFFEPSLLFQAGFPNVSWMKFDVGMNFATNPLSSKSNEDAPPTVYENRDLRSRKFLLSLGLSFYPFEGKRK
ncbi:hypothetical protein [Niabella drilacis]|uniref:Outer membrane protein beta-barrel domain-containing protein n=1 Tax=Niabella drilacis (strain DSM 25811 / CCM 8410 / CCUG 62505 / LMG 26954 / E90) TaxID=1285928 RepID=A0A1G6PQI2_NIADE|nr:hypothetical protein [Niabella drilacis]SDC81904.1 hypothetical protein SAMN04487894_104112 [Niabella drilacis]